MMKKVRPLTHEVKKDSTLTVGAFDIETNGLFGEYLDGFLKYDDDTVYYRALSMDAMFELIMSRSNVCLYAHNANGYEMNYLIDVLKIRKDLPVDLIVAGGKVIGMVFRNGDDNRIEIRDSLAIMPMSLKDACKAYKVQFDKTDIGLSEGIIYDPSNIEHQEYCKNDVRITIECVKNFKVDVKDVFGCGISFTSASTALAAWKTTIDKDTMYRRYAYPLEVEVRRAYYGAIVYPGKTINVIQGVKSIDRNAAYAAAMMEGVPYGRTTYVDSYNKNLAGIYHVKVKSPPYSKHFIPVIPYRDDKNILKWPVGSFRTIITSIEIDMATKLGYEVEVEHGYVFDKWIYPFNDFVNLCASVEETIPEKKSIVKLMRNSLYGKFGTKLISHEYAIGQPEDEGWYPLIDEVSGDINFRVYSREKVNESNYVMPLWACFITAFQRRWVFETMYKVGAEHVVYGDTDSVKAKSEAVTDAIARGDIVLSNKYGDCKVDEDYMWFQCLGPKVYRGELTNGSMKARAKGIPYRALSQELFTEAYNNIYNPVSYVSSNSTLARLKKPEREMKIEAHRCITNFRNSETWNVDQNGNIIPPYIEIGE